MYRVGAFVRAFALGAIMGSCCVSRASADIYIDDVRRAIFFSGSDLWRHGLFSYGGLIWSPNGLDHEGFTLKLLLGGGRYRYISGALGNTTIIGEQNVALILPGWRFHRERLSLSVFAGLDTQYHWLTPYDPSNRLRGFRIGARGGLDLWFEPAQHTMIATDASISSVGPSYSARLALGWRLPGLFYVGPEISGFAQRSEYNQFRIGMHITGLRTYQLEWSAGFGWAFDSDERDSLYGRLGVLIRK
jgi:hypothetical protein